MEEVADWIKKEGTEVNLTSLNRRLRLREEQNQMLGRSEGRQGEDLTNLKFYTILGGLHIMTVTFSSD